MRRRMDRPKSNQSPGMPAGEISVRRLLVATILLAPGIAFADSSVPGVPSPVRPVPGAGQGYCIGVAPENCFYPWSFNDGWMSCWL
jgi:hypothetical protein